MNYTFEKPPSPVASPKSSIELASSTAAHTYRQTHWSKGKAVRDIPQKSFCKLLDLFVGLGGGRCHRKVSEGSTSGSEPNIDSTSHLHVHSCRHVRPMRSLLNKTKQTKQMIQPSWLLAKLKAPFHRFMRQ